MIINLHKKNKIMRFIDSIKFLGILVILENIRLDAKHFF